MDAPMIMYRFVDDDAWHELCTGLDFQDAVRPLLQLLADPTIADIRFDEAYLPPGDMRRLDWERFKELCLDFIEEGRERSTASTSCSRATSATLTRCGRTS